eukprot:TRINITY_DN5470_c1_g1_i2.p1 TRINITY_DN5470_c1_g1~~TRINITY_DN5470_c1_g1_i2.p1  ORF type:complete len:126 (-),score=0.55 TRINITY_DN5470_c1_g1_i2:168-545(-)
MYVMTRFRSRLTRASPGHIRMCQCPSCPRGFMSGQALLSTPKLQSLLVSNRSPGPLATTNGCGRIDGKRPCALTAKPVHAAAHHTLTTRGTLQHCSTCPEIDTPGSLPESVGALRKKCDLGTTDR